MQNCAFELPRIPLPRTSVNRPSFERRWASFCGMLGGVGRAGHNRAASGPMTQRASTLLKTGWISLAIIGVAILLFGLITLVAYRRRERWAWFALWYYPLFWTAHLVGGLPPGKVHVHQVVFIILSLVGLLLPVREFFGRREA